MATGANSNRPRQGSSKAVATKRMYFRMRSSSSEVFPLGFRRLSHGWTPFQQPHQQRQQPQRQSRDTQRRSNRSFEERQQIATGFDHRRHEVLFHNGAKYDAENHRRHGKAIFFQDIG